MRKQSICLVLALALLTMSAGTALAERGNPNAVPGELSQPVYSWTMDEFVQIPMRDGTITHAWVYLPEGEGPWPTIMCSSPYETMYIVSHEGERWAERGYAWVYREVRGRGGSEGMFDHTSMHIDRDDNWDTIDWIISQPWSNGKVGANGASYPGQTALQAVLSGHPNLLCALVVHTSSNPWRDGWYYRNGVFELGFASGWAAVQFGLTTAPRILEGEALENYQDELAMYKLDQDSHNRAIPLIDFAPTQIGPDYNLVKTWLEHPTFDLFWAERSADTWFDTINVPILSIAGIYDIFQNGNIALYQSVTERGLTAHARDNQRLLLTPNAHSNGTVLYPAAFGLSDFKIGHYFSDEHVAFADYWLKDTLTKEFDPELPVQYFTTGENTWNYSAQWPLPGVVETSVYLNDSKSGSIASLNDGSLSWNLPATGAEPASYVYDPIDPTPTQGGNIILFYELDDPMAHAVSGPKPQNAVDETSLTFTSAPLDAPLQVSGKVRAVIYASSDCVDTDFVVRLNDVHPDGTSFNLADGVVRARYRNSVVVPQLMVPGEVYEMEVDLWTISHVFQPGHSLRVTINSSSFPRWSRNMNVAEFPEQATDYVVANNTIYLDPEHPSHVILPVIPR